MISEVDFIDRKRDKIHLKFEILETWEDRKWPKLSI